MTEGANDANKSADSYKELYQDLLGRIKILGIVVASIVIDSAFIIAWVWLHHFAEYLLHFLSSSKAIKLNVIAATILESTFTICTLMVVLVYVIADLYHSVRTILRGVFKKRGRSE